MQRRVKSLRDKRFADVEHGQRVTPDKLGNFGIRFVGMEQDVGMPDRGGRGFTTVNEAFEERTLVVGKGNGVLAFPHDDIFNREQYNCYYNNEGQKALGSRPIAILHHNYRTRFIYFIEFIIILTIIIARSRHSIF